MNYFYKKYLTFLNLIYSDNDFDNIIKIKQYKDADYLILEDLKLFNYI